MEAPRNKRVAGLGFRAGASVHSLRNALRREAAEGLTALATAEDKASAPALQQLAADMGLPIIAVPLSLLAVQPAAPRARVPARYGARSLAEAAALAAAGPLARLLMPRQISDDGLATAAIAQHHPEEGSTP